MIFNNWILRLDLLARADVDGKCNLKAFTSGKRVFLSSRERIDLGIGKKKEDIQSLARRGLLP